MGDSCPVRALRSNISKLTLVAAIAAPGAAIARQSTGQPPPTSGQQQQQQQGQQGAQQGLGGGAPTAQPAQPGQQQQRRDAGRTSNQTEVTPASQQRPVQPPAAPPTPSQAPSRGTVGEPAGTTTPRAPVGQGGLALPNTSVPATGAVRTVENAPSTLSLSDAEQIAIENNLSTLLAESRTDEAKTVSRQQLAALLPNLYGTAFQQNRTLNLRAQGISSGSTETTNETTGQTNGPGSGMSGGSGFTIPSFVGPFDTFDARVYLAQSIFDLAAIRDYKSARTGVAIARYGEDLAREQVATLVAIFYLNVMRSGRDVEAAQADLTLAEELARVAHEQRDAGVATGVDVVRAETRVSQERLRLLNARTSDEQARLDFQRVVGLPQGRPLTLVDPLRFVDEQVPSPDATVAAAIAARPEARIAEETVRQREQTRDARSADRYPSLEAYGDYGESGATPWRFDRPTRTYGVRLNVPIFDGGLTRARVDQASEQAKQAELQFGNVRGQVEEDVRLAIVSLRTAAEQVRTVDEQFDLATRELELARMRFLAGVADNTEVVAAQAALSNARSLQVEALAQYTAARLNLAAAGGRAREFRF